MKKISALLLLLLQFNILCSQADSVFKLPHPIIGMSENGATSSVSLLKFWKYHKGDNIKWADPLLNDSDWEYHNTIINLVKLPPKTFEGNCWFRLKIEVDTQLVNKTLALLVTQFGASEIYLDGQLIHTFGKVSSDPLLEKRFEPNNIPVDIRFEKTRKHLLAVRYSNTKAVEFYDKNMLTSAGFVMGIGELVEEIRANFSSGNGNMSVFTFYFAFFFALSIVHFMLFIYYRSNKSNLYYSIFLLSFGLLFVFLLVEKFTTNPDAELKTIQLLGILNDIYCPSLLAMLYIIFSKKIPKIFWLWISIYVFDLVTTIFNCDFDFMGIVGILVASVEALRIIVFSIIKKRDGAWIIGSGVITTVTLLSLFGLLTFSGHINMKFGGESGRSDASEIVSLIFGFIAIYATLSIPVSMTVYLARDFARTSKNLEKKLVEVEDLSAKNLEQEKEKAQILENQNVTLEKQVNERTAEISSQKKVIEEKNKDITDSINYALRIQEATLPPKELKYKLFPDAFVLYKPKDIVSGDFYWFYEKDNLKYIAAADCTGHGVPGALVSVVCTNAMNRTLKEFGLTRPDEILNKTRELVLETFEKSNREVKDGMDISLVLLENKSSSSKINIQWAGANNPIWYLEKGEFKEITANKQSIGKTEKPVPFTNHTITLNKGDSFYLFSDGYADQFGGPKGKKLKYNQLKEFILSIQNKTMPEQEKYLDAKFEEWKAWPAPDGTPKKVTQIDDVLVIGVKV